MGVTRVHFRPLSYHVGSFYTQTSHLKPAGLATVVLA